MQEEKTKGVVLPATDKEALPRLPTREEEVEQARQVGQDRREAIQCMKEAADAYESPQHLCTKATHPSVFGDITCICFNNPRLQLINTPGEGLIPLITGGVAIPYWGLLLYLGASSAR